MRQRIIQKLEALNYMEIDLIDESHKHRGHIDGKEYETHFKLTIVSDSFIGQTIVNRHKMVYTLLSDELATGGLHALSISALTEEEYKMRQ